uniref:PsbP C-terminal domain-containing protein n=1 Tax=Kalanchoe fedtschenkoi TaxID=63787 RepID=A0A7N0TX19_KALFE
MMALRICSALSSSNIISSAPINAPHLNLAQIHKEPSLIASKCTVSRRKLDLSLVAVALAGSLLNIGDAIAEQGQDLANELDRYTDSEEGFTLLKPHSWNKVEKAGANVLFEEGGNNIGVVVTPVRLSKLSDFGTPQFVADKLIQAEKRKESTNDARLIEFKERSGQGGLEVYEFEYEVDSSRGGLKKIFSAAFVASKKLYLLNIAHSDKPENPIDAHTRLMLESVLHSFDLAPSA